MVKLRLLERNLPDQVRDATERLRRVAADQLLAGLRRTVTNDADELVTVWVPAAHRFMDVYKFSRKERKSAVEMLEASVGGLGLSLDGLQSTLALANRMLKCKPKLEIVMDWKKGIQMYREIGDRMQGIAYSKAQVAGVLSELATFIRLSRKYFPPDSSSEIISYFKSQISPGSESIEPFVFLCNLLPNTGGNNCTWVELLLSLLCDKQRNLNAVINAVYCLSVTAKHYPALDWDRFLPEIYNLVMPAMPLLTKQLPRPKTHFFEGTRTALFTSKFMTRSSSFAKLVAYTLNDTNFPLLEQWWRNMAGIIKEGKMICSGCLNYIAKVVANYCKRIRLANEGKGNRPSEELTKKLVTVTMPYVNLVFYTGHLSQIDRLCTDLCYLWPEMVIPGLVEKAIEVIEDYNVPHMDAINILERIVKPMLEPTVFDRGLEYLPLILNVTLTELTSADIQKACKILNLYGQVAAMIPLDNAIDAIPIWAEEFFRTLLPVLSELEANSENKQEKNQSYRIEETLENNMKILASAVSPEILHAWIDQFIEFINRNTYSNAISEFGIIASNLARISPDLVLMPLWRLADQSLDQGKSQLLWKVAIFSSALLRAGEGLAVWGDKIESLADRLMEKNPENAGALVANYLTGLLQVYPLRFAGPVPGVDWNENTLNTRGKVSNQLQGTDLRIQWYVPTENSIQTANKILEKYAFKLGTSKTEVKSCLKVVPIVLKVWSQFYNTEKGSNGEIQIPEVEVYAKLLDFESNAEKIVRRLREVVLSFEDPIIIEGFAGLVSIAMHNEDYSILEVKKVNKPVSIMKHKYQNPLVPYTLKNQSETRTYLIFRTQSHLLTMTACQLSQKRFSATADYFLHTLLELAESPYKQVRIKAIGEIDTVLKSSFIGLKNIIKAVWAEKAQNLALNDPEKLKIQLEFLMTKNALWRKDIANNDFFVIDLIRATHNLPDIELQTQVFNLFCNYFISSNPRCTVKNGSITLEPVPEIAQKVKQLIDESQSYHWRSKLYALLYIHLNISSLFNTFVVPELKLFLTSCLLDENIDIRETSVLVLNSLLYNQLRHEYKEEYIPFIPSESIGETQYLDLASSSGALTYKPYQGWWPCTDSIKTQAKVSQTQTDAVLDFFTTPAKVAQFIQFSAVGHMLATEEHIVKNPRTAGLEDTNFSIRFLNNPYKFLLSMMGGRSRFFQTATNFSKTKAKLVKLVGKLHGEEAMRILAEACKEFMGKDKEHQLAAVEIIAGIGRCCRIWNKNQLFIEILEHILQNCSIHGLQNWTESFGYLCQNQTVEHLTAVFRLIISKVSGFSSKKLGKWLKVTTKIIESLAWRGVKVYHELIDVVEALPHDAFAELRKNVSEAISKVVSATSFISDTLRVNRFYSTLAISSTEFLYYYTPVLGYVERLSQKTDPLSQQLLIDILSQIFSSANIDITVFPFIVKVFPTIVLLLKNPDIKIVTQVSDMLKAICPARCTPALCSLLTDLVTTEGSTDSKVQEMIKGLFLTILWFFNQYTSQPAVLYFCSMIQSNVVEVKQLGKFYLSMIFKVLDEKAKEKEFREAKEVCRNDSTVGVYRIAALVSAQNVFVEKWKGEGLSMLCRMKKIGGEVGLCVNSTLAEFWKNHKMWWKNYMKYRTQFTEEELEWIEAFSSDHSYFA
jgi:hypothetical protein